MPFLFIGIIGVGFLFAFYDVFDINVSFIQSCVALKPGCTPANAITALRVPVVLNLAGYVVGALVLAPISDRIGRRNMLMITMLITGAGSLYNALAPDYTNFVLARVLTGIGVGADLAIVNTYVGEVAPRRNRARWISMIFIMSSVGCLLGIWLGLLLTTAPAPWPNGLSFAQAGASFSDGWRWMYGDRSADGADRDHAARALAGIPALAGRTGPPGRGGQGRRCHGDPGGAPQHAGTATRGHRRRRWAGRRSALRRVAAATAGMSDVWSSC